MLYNSEIISTSSIICFLDNMGRWERSPIKQLKFRESVDNITEKVLECNKIWDIKCCIRFHHESRDFHEIIICIEQQDFIFVHNYFDDVKHPVNTYSMIIHALIKNYTNEVNSPLNKMCVNLHNDKKRLPQKVLKKVEDIFVWVHETIF